MRKWYTNGDTKQWWKISKENWTGGEKRRTWLPKKSEMTIGQYGQFNSHWTKRKKKAKRGKDTTQKRKLKQQPEMTGTEIQTM